MVDVISRVRLSTRSRSCSSRRLDSIAFRAACSWNDASNLFLRSRISSRCPRRSAGALLARACGAPAAASRAASRSPPRCSASPARCARPQPLQRRLRPGPEPDASGGSGAAPPAPTPTSLRQRTLAREWRRHRARSIAVGAGIAVRCAVERNSRRICNSSLRAARAPPARFMFAAALLATTAASAHRRRHDAKRARRQRSRA